MTKKPLISIITVVFNGKNYLLNTIISIQKQTYNYIEYIIVDGGSTDGTLDVIQAHENFISKWISEPDKGLYDAMNKGLKMATGDYVWFINAGDEIYDEYTLDNIFDTKKALADIYYGQTLIIDEQREPIGLRRLKPTGKLTWKSFIWGQLVSHQAFIARKSITSLYDLSFSFSADTDWQIKALKAAEKIEDTGLTICRFLEGGRSKQTIIPSLKERFIILKKNYGIFLTIIVHIIMIPRFFIFYLIHKRF